MLECLVVVLLLAFPLSAMVVVSVVMTEEGGEKSFHVFCNSHNRFNAYRFSHSWMSAWWTERSDCVLWKWVACGCDGMAAVTGWDWLPVGVFDGTTAVNGWDWLPVGVFDGTASVIGWDWLPVGVFDGTATVKCNWIDWSWKDPKVGLMMFFSQECIKYIM